MGSREDLQGAEPKIELFLSDLAVNGQVAASTQNQAFNALAGKGRTSNAEHRTSNVERGERPRAMNGDYDLEKRLLEYSARIIRLVERLPNTRAGNHVAGQLLRSGTSPLPNHGEAQAAESANDFVHKLKICLKELRESYR